MLPDRDFTQCGKRSIPETPVDPQNATAAEPKAGTLSVIIPVFNEARSLGPLLAALREALKAAPLTLREVLVIDDGSVDDTAAVLEEAALGWPCIRVLRHERNRGQAAGLWTGFQAARGDLIVTLDGDGQNPPGDIPGMIEKLLLTGADMVIGVRASRSDSWVRKRMSRLANGVRSRFLGDGVSDSGCAMKVFRREVMASFVPIRTLYSFMPAMAVSASYRVVELAVAHQARQAGESKYGARVMLWRPLVDMLGMWWLMRRSILRAQR